MLKLGFQCRRGNAFTRVLVGRRKAAVELCLLCSGQGELVVFQTVPQLRDERKALQRSQPNKLVMGK